MVREPLPPSRSRTPAALIALIVFAALVLLAALIVLTGDRAPASPATTPAASGTAAAAATPSASASVAPTPSAPAAASAAPTSPPAESEPPAPSATAASAAPGASVAPTATALALPDTPIEAVLDEAYDSSGIAYDPSVVGGLEPGDVTARWYVAEGRWLVHYEGLDLEQTGRLCPGSSILTAAGSFESVSNAPTEPGACEGFDATLAEAPVGVRLCGTTVLYLSAIPSDAVGTLFGSVERAASDGSVHGITSRAETSAGTAPEIDLEALGCEVVEPR